MRFALAAAFLVCLAAAATAESGRYWVQIIAALDETSAQLRLDELVRRSELVRAARTEGRIAIYRHVDKRGTFWRVRIGPFEDHEGARRYCGRLRAEGLSCLAVS
jgi:cell division septation protein DedD